MQEYSDPRLLALARSGDQEAFSQLMTRYQPMALHLAVRMIGNQENAYEEIVERELTTITDCRPPRPSYTALIEPSA